jgi:hypothetical protein
MMRARTPLLPLVILTLLMAGRAFDITRFGKRIQLDGFLIDWNESGRRSWGGWYWDAINTPEGVAGYFSSASVRCAAWTFILDAAGGASRPRVMAVTNAADGAVRGYTCVNSEPHGSAAAVTVEWLLPWDSLAVDSAGAYAVRMAGTSACGDTLRSLLLKGSAGARRGRNVAAPGFLFWCGCAAACAAGCFLIVRRRYCQTRMRRRGSLRR